MTWSRDCCSTSPMLGLRRMDSFCLVSDVAVPAQLFSHFLTNCYYHTEFSSLTGIANLDGGQATGSSVGHGFNEGWRYLVFLDERTG